MMIAVNEINNDKTKVRDEFNFRSVSLFVLLPNLMCKLIHNRRQSLRVSLLLKLRLHACMETNSLF